MWFGRDYLQLFRSMLKSIGNPAVQHNFRKANKVADSLARASFSLSQFGEVVSLRSPSSSVAVHLQNDVDGVFCDRFVSWSLFKSEEDKTNNNFNKNQGRNDGSNSEISRAALQAEDKAPPPLACDDGVLNELTIFVKNHSVDIRRPNEATWLFAFSPPNEFNPLMYLTLIIFLKDFLPVSTMVVELTVAAESVAIVF
ncbi:hypothetical protein FXO37_05838 [Capsicum annuum]|nr:hypothetical protein FXO37_05838 [Capsicum annuum]